MHDISLSDEVEETGSMDWYLKAESIKLLIKLGDEIFNFLYHSLNNLVIQSKELFDHLCWLLLLNNVKSLVDLLLQIIATWLSSEISLYYLLDVINDSVDLHKLEKLPHPVFNSSWMCINSLSMLRIGKEIQILLIVRIFHALDGLLFHD